MWLKAISFIEPPAASSTERIDSRMKRVCALASPMPTVLPSLSMASVPET
jgi:hypothetical protein